MPRRRRVSTGGLIFHVVNRAAKRSTLFENEADYSAFERVLSAAVDRSDVSLFAYCVMPNHWHLVLSPGSDGALSRFMHWLTTTHARRWQTCRALDGQGAVYQGRFKAIPVADDRHFLWVCRYVERNPLRAGLVERVDDWRWSSIGKRDTSWLSAWPMGRPMNWIALANQPQTEAELIAFRSAMAHGEPFGDDAWRDAVKQILGIRRGVPGRRPRVGCPQQMTPDPITRTSLRALPIRSRR